MLGKVEKKYDENGRIIEESDSFGGVKKYYYNSDMVTTHFKKRDSRGNIIEYIIDDPKDGIYHTISEYNDMNLKTYYKTTLGNLEIWYEYDSSGILIYSRDSRGNIEKWEYDSSGNKISYKRTEVIEEYKEYDSSGNEIYIKQSSGLEYWFEYNSKGNMVHYKNSEGLEYWQEFDENGYLVYHKDSDGNEEFYGE